VALVQFEPRLFLEEGIFLDQGQDIAIEYQWDLLHVRLRYVVVNYAWRFGLTWNCVSLAMIFVRIAARLRIAQLFRIF
jgi:hypothetical protein